MAKIKAFFGTPLGKFVFDIIDAAVLGAAFAAVALPDSITAKDALGLIVGGAIGSVKGAARFALQTFIAQQTKDTPTP